MLAAMPSQPSSAENATPFAAGDRITVVSGLPRAGTSLMMQLLEAAGLPIAEDGARPADPDNPRGYYELAAVRRIERDAGFLDVCRGRVVKVVAPLVRALPTRHAYRVVFLERDLREILASQRAMLERARSRPGSPSAQDADEALTRAFASTLRACREFLASAPDCETLFVEHRALIEDPRRSVARLADFLAATGGDARALALDGPGASAVARARCEAAMVAVIDRTLHRQRS